MEGPSYLTILPSLTPVYIAPVESKTKDSGPPEGTWKVTKDEAERTIIGKEMRKMKQQSFVVAMFSWFQF